MQLARAAHSDGDTLSPPVAATSPQPGRAESADTQTSTRGFQIVVAATLQHGIGVEGRLPWKLKHDMNHFKEVTSKAAPAKSNAVIMGRKTWDSIPAKFRPLAGRLNVVLSRSAEAGGAFPEGVQVCGSLPSALELLAGPEWSERIDFVFLIGGGELFREAMGSPLCEAIHLTEVAADVPCDTFMPPPDLRRFSVWSASCPAVEAGLRYSFVTYVARQHLLDSSRGEGTQLEPEPAACASPGHPPRLPEAIARKHEEFQYLDLVRDIIGSGALRSDRTGTGVLSKFGCQMRFNLRKSFPLLTTKRVFWRGVVEELLWLISGSTSAKVLQEKGIHIWDGNASREYLDSIGLSEREEGDLGPVYGFQWRHFGAKYTDMHADYSGQGVDQLADVIHKLRHAPHDRRIVLSAWNPADLRLMALPPCHMFAQFYVADGELSCQMYQRSCDMGLGVPFNIASYALLTCMIAHVCDLQVGDFIHVLGDAHVYSNHVEPLKEQLLHSPRPFPTLVIKGRRRDIDAFSADDFELLDYSPHKKIAMKMAV